MKYPLNNNLGDLAEETGIHIGDGSMNFYASQRGKGCYTVAGHHIDDREYINKIVLPLVKKVYGKTPKPRNWSQGTYGFRIVNNDIVNFKHTVLGLPLGKKVKLEIPELIIQDLDLTKRFLRGLVSTDGSVTVSTVNGKPYPRIYLSSISKELILQVKEILKKMGFRVSYWEGKQVESHWKLQYKLHLNGIEMLKKWNEEIGFNNPKQATKARCFYE